jgi:DNA-binding XRE family transcriptional regulator
MTLDSAKFSDGRGFAFFRHKRHLTQAELARRCGLSRQFINIIEAGRAQPNVRVALHLAAILDCSVDDLFSGAETKE